VTPPKQINKSVTEPSPLREVNQVRVRICDPHRVPRLHLTCDDRFIVAHREDSQMLNIDSRDSPEVVINHLGDFCMVTQGEDAILDVPDRSFVTTRAAAMLALFVAHSCHNIYNASDLSLDVVAAHAIPLTSCTGIRIQIYAIIDEITSAEQLLLLPRSEAVAVDPSVCSFEAIELQHLKVLRRNADLISQPSDDTDGLLDRWSNHCIWRFREPLPAKIRSILRKLFALNGFEILEYRDEGGYVASSLLYIDYGSQTIFDIIAPWSSSAKWRRVGIYMAVQNLLRAHRARFRYSLCYGNSPYKAEIVVGLPRINI